MFSISTNSFTQKPTSDEIRKINYKRKDLNIDEVINHIRGGYVFSANFCDDYTTSITQRDRTYERFISTPMVMFDMDGCVDCSLVTLLDSLKYKPTVSYTTFSHNIGGKGNRYRLLYLFEDPITDTRLYKSIYKEIKSSFDFELDDNCGSNPCQAIFGSLNDCEVIVTDSSYSVDDFNISTEKGLSNFIKKEKRNNIEIESLFRNDEYKSDFYHLSYAELLDKYRYVYPFFEHTPLPVVSDDCPYIILPKNYISIRRYWLCEKVEDEYGEGKWRYAKIRKIKDGEQRRKKLYLNGILRRKMIPDITFEHLLYCLIFELYYFYENSKDTIKKLDILNIARNVMMADIANYSFEQTDKRQFVINEAYCRKYNVSKKEARNLSKKLINYEKIGELYDPTLTDKKNIELFKQYGLSISSKTLQRFRGEMGLKKYKK